MYYSDSLVNWTWPFGSWNVLWASCEANKLDYSLRIYSGQDQQAPVHIYAEEEVSYVNTECLETEGNFVFTFQLHFIVSFPSSYCQTLASQQHLEASTTQMWDGKILIPMQRTAEINRREGEAQTKSNESSKVWDSWQQSLLPKQSVRQLTAIVAVHPISCQEVMGFCR